MKTWYSIQNKADSADISIHDEIGFFGISAKEFLSDLKGVDSSSINLSVNSPGGNVFDGLAIYNELKAHKATVNVSVAGVAGSIASVIAMAGDSITMPEDAFLMIHNPFAMAAGGAEEMRDTADLLDKITDTIVNVYEKKTGLDSDEIRNLMADETWMNGKEAREKGFIDDVTNQKVAACSQFSNRFKNAPFNSAEELAFEAIKDFTAYLRESCGKSRSESEKVTKAVKDLFQSDSGSDEPPLDGVLEALNKLNSRL